MGSKAFEASLAAGPHQRLARMAGDWQGRFRIWFQPGVLGDESTQRGRIRPVLGGRFLLHEYTGSCGGEPVEGLAIYGHEIDEQSFQSAWIESFGTGTAIMFSIGRPDDPRLSMLGSYGDGAGGPRWGWRTEIEQAGDDRLDIRMFNITPSGEEALAVHVEYERTTV